MKKIISLVIISLLCFTSLVSANGLFTTDRRSPWKYNADGDLAPAKSGAGIAITGSVSAALTRVEVTGTSTLTDQQVKGTYITNYGMGSGGDTTLPAFSGTAMFVVETEVASQAWSFKPPSGELFSLDGTLLDANDEIDCGQTLRDFGKFVRARTGASTWQWQFWSGQGAYSDGGAS